MNISLTDGQREIYDLLTQHKNGTLRRHKSHSGRPCYRLMDTTISPVRNISDAVMAELIDRGAVVLEGERFRLVNLTAPPKDYSGIGLVK